MNRIDRHHAHSTEKIIVMNLLFVNLPFNERIIQALCWTLVHSLWQGVLLAVLTGLAILLTRRSGPVLRYGLFSALFFLFFLGSCLTFLRQWDRAAGSAGSGIVIRTEERVAGGSVAEQEDHGLTVLPVYRNWMDRAGNYFNEHAYLIVAVWLVFFSFRLARITAQLGAQQRLRHYRVHSPSLYWTERVGELARRLKIKARVALLESEIVKVPMVAGFIKPVILLPLSVLSQLSPAQVEAILLHELAHIRRKDYLVNLLFSLGEMFFFFNPGVLWICSLIREERENCCDDIAVRQAGSKKEFISALVSFQDRDRRTGQYAIAFPGSGEHLLQRVRRIVYRDNKTLDGREKFFLVCCFLIGGALMVAFTQAVPRNGNFRPDGSGRRVLTQSLKRDTTGRDTLSGEKDRVERYPDGKERAYDTAAPMRPVEPMQPMQTVQTAQPVQTLPPVQRKAAKKEKVKPVIREEKDTLSEVDDKDGEQGVKEMSQREKDLEQLEKDMHQKDMEMEQREKDVQKDVQKEQRKQRMEIDREKKKLDRQNREEQNGREGMERHMQDRRDTLPEGQDRVDQAERRIRVQQDRIRQEEKRLAQESRRVAEEGWKIQEQQARIEQQTLAIQDQEFKKAAIKMKVRIDANTKIDAETKTKIRMDANEAGALAPTPPQRIMQLESNRKVLTPIIDELMREHRIGNKEFLTFSLDNNNLIVNGVQQPQDIFQHFRQKFIGDPGDRIYYSRTRGGHESVSINIHSTHL
jgi:bla regulator protein BlaR1